MLKPADSSIFIKLLLILIATGVLINLVVMEGTRFLIFSVQRPPTLMRKNFDQYADYLVKDLGSPPSREKAFRIAQDLGVGIRLESEHLNWATANDIPKAEQVKNLQLPPPKFRLSLFSKPTPRPRHFYTVEKIFPELGRVNITIEEASPPHLEPSAFDLWSLIAVVTLIVAISYIFIRRLLMPVRFLSEGVNQIKLGNLEHAVPIHSQDELGKLAGSFNEMTRRIKETLQAKEQLLIDVSHELRSPLTRAVLSLELIKDPVPKEQIGEDLSEMAAMIHELLESARLESGYGSLALTDINLSAIIQETVERYQSQLPGIKIENLPTKQLRADSDRIKTVLKNVIENAIKYSPEIEPVRVNLYTEANQTIVEISDRGIGIPASELDRVFEPFYRTDKSRNRNTGGFGLGLSLCRKIMRAHGGEITLQSQEKKGTIVKLVFPG